MSPPKPVLSIAAAVLQREGRFLVAKRPPGSHCGGRWEFPGGKIRMGESAEEAARRELEEETGAVLDEAVLLHVEEHAYEERAVRLHFFLALRFHGAPEGREGQELRWVTIEELQDLEIPPGNRSLVNLLVEQFGDP